MTEFQVFSTALNLLDTKLTTVSANLSTLTVDMALVKRDVAIGRQIGKYLCGIVSGVAVGLLIYFFNH